MINKLTTALLLFFTIFLSAPYAVAQQSNPSKLLIGKWKFVSKKTITETPTTINEETESYISPLTMTYQFKANGKGEMTKTYVYEGESDSQVFDINKWSVKGDKISVLTEYDSMENYQYMIQGKNLIIFTSYKEEDEIVSIRYTLSKS